MTDDHTAHTTNRCANCGQPCEAGVDPDGWCPACAAEYWRGYEDGIRRAMAEVRAGGWGRRH
jgi:hypothetical protein